MTKTFYITYWASKHKKHILQDKANMMRKADMVLLKMEHLIMFIMI